MQAHIRSGHNLQFSKNSKPIDSRLFSSVAEDFVSEPLEVQRALETVSQAVQPLKEQIAVSWIVDRGFDDVVVCVKSA